MSCVSCDTYTCKLWYNTGHQLQKGGIVVSARCEWHAGEHLQESFPVLQQVFLASLKDSSPEVRRTALQAVASMVPWLDEEPHIALFKDLVPLAIQVG